MAGLFDKGKEFLDSDKGEDVSDTALDRASDLAGNASHGHEDAVQKAREEADKRLGNE